MKVSNTNNTLTSKDLELLYDQVKEMTEKLEAQAKRTMTRGDWQAAVWLRQSLYDIHGAFAYLALDEEEDHDHQG